MIVSMEEIQSRAKFAMECLAEGQRLEGKVAKHLVRKREQAYEMAQCSFDEAARMMKKWNEVAQNIKTVE